MKGYPGYIKLHIKVLQQFIFVINGWNNSYVMCSMDQGS